MGIWITFLNFLYFLPSLKTSLNLWFLIKYGNWNIFFIDLLSFLTFFENALKSLIPNKIGISVYIFSSPLLYYLFYKVFLKISHFYNTHCRYLITFLNVLYFYTSSGNVLKSLIPNKIIKSLQFFSFSSLLNLINKVFK